MEKTASKEFCIDYEKPKRKTSTLRKIYIARLVLRCIILAACILYAIYLPEKMEVLSGWNFFRMLTPLHILWVVWVLDMLWQLIPVKNKIALGSQKLFEFRFLFYLKLILKLSLYVFMFIKYFLFL
mgnify:CR=1 FL=1